MTTTRSSQPGGSRPAPPRTPSRGGRGGGGGAGRGRRRKPNPILNSLAIAIQFVFVVLALVILTVLGCFFYLYENLPSADSQIKEYRPPGRAMIYSSDGILLADLFQQNRKVVTIDQIPVQLQNATISIEDQFMLTHNLADKLSLKS